PAGDGPLPLGHSGERRSAAACDPALAGRDGLELSDRVRHPQPRRSAGDVPAPLGAPHAAGGVAGVPGRSDRAAHPADVSPSPGRGIGGHVVKPARRGEAGFGLLMALMVLFLLSIALALLAGSL